jgi:hypothetical protein
MWFISSYLKSSNTSSSLCLSWYTILACLCLSYESLVITLVQGGWHDGKKSSPSSRFKKKDFPAVVSPDGTEQIHSTRQNMILLILSKPEISLMSVYQHLYYLPHIFTRLIVGWLTSKGKYFIMYIQYSGKNKPRNIIQKWQCLFDRPVAQYGQFLLSIFFAIDIIISGNFWERERVIHFFNYPGSHLNK